MATEQWNCTMKQRQQQHFQRRWPDWSYRHGDKQTSTHTHPAPVQVHCSSPCERRQTRWRLDAGGVGPTIMETSYLLAGTPVIAYADGKQVQAKPISQPLTVDFGKGLGRKTVWLYNLPEVESAFKYMKVPNVSARFGTDPGELKGASCSAVLQAQLECLVWSTRTGF